MNEALINDIANSMASQLNCGQLKQLKKVLQTKLLVSASQVQSNQDLLRLFLQAKEVEGRSANTLAYYQSTIGHLLGAIKEPLCQITAYNLREYLGNYQTINNSSRVTIDNIRRIFSSFFSWLEDEDYIVKSPVRRIHKVKTPTVVQETLNDEHLETLRDNCSTVRDLAIVDMLTSTGMRIGELIKLDIADINFVERECIVQGKGNKQRHVYFDARTKLHLLQYIKSRQDTNPALFVTLSSPYKRLKIGGVELRLRNLGRKLNLPSVHPHKFRRTLATNAIDKGMPIEQVQKLLGHARIDTTMHYALVNQNNVKLSHRKYLG